MTVNPEKVRGVLLPDGKWYDVVPGSFKLVGVEAATWKEVRKTWDPNGTDAREREVTIYREAPVSSLQAFIVEAP